MSENVGMVGSTDAATAALRVPPHSIDAEQAVLGGLMLDNRAWDQVADQVDEDDFYRRDHRLIFRAIRQLAESSRPLDVVTLSDWLAGINELDNVGGLAYLGALARDTPSAANVSAYARIVRERSILRQLIHVGTEIGNTAFSPEGRSMEELLDDAERRVFEIAERGSRGGGGFQGIKDLLTKAVDRIDTLFEQDNPITGIATGFDDFDELTSGLQRSDLIIVAGRPSMGKTTFAMNLAETAAIKGGAPVAVFSMEMPGEQLALRMMSSLGRIDQHRVRTGKLDDDDWPRLTSAVSILSETKLFIDDSPALTPTELRARSRRLKREHPDLALIVVDYLQLMQVPGTRENRATEISEISRALKSLAKELHVPVIALSQLNRSLEQRPNKRPVMSDLRECVTGDSLVVLAEGRRVPIRDLVGLHPEVISVDGEGKLVHAVANQVWRVGRRPVLAVRLASGGALRATAEHRLLAAEGWQNVGSMRAGQRLAMARQLPEPEVCDRWPEHELIPLAHLVGDGSYRNGQPLRVHAGSDLCWDTVVAVEPAGEDDVYDLSVPGCGSWLADGVVSHNSGAIEQDADLIVFIYRDEVYKEDSPDKGTAEIIVAKQRNGPIGTVRLTFLGQYTRFENFMPQRFDEGHG